MKGVSKKRILAIAILSLMFYLGGGAGDDLPGTWLYKIYAGVAYFLLLLGLSFLWDILVEKWLRIRLANGNEHKAINHNFSIGGYLVGLIPNLG